MALGLQQRVALTQNIQMSLQLQKAISLLKLSNQEICEAAEDIAGANPLLRVEQPDPQSAYYGTTSRLSFNSCSSLGSNDLMATDQIVDPNEPSLYAHVFKQADRVFDCPAQRRVAYALCEAIEPTGWLGVLVRDIPVQLNVSSEMVDDVLSRLQMIEPAGLFARDLRECLMLQAMRSDQLDYIMVGLLDNLPMLAEGRIAALCKRLKCSPEECSERLRRIHRYDPKPGLHFRAEPPGLCAPPDLLVRSGPNGWTVDLNRSTLPKISVGAPNIQAISAQMRGMQDRIYLRESLSAAHWFKRAVYRRNATILRIGSEIVRCQTSFLQHGPTHLLPMRMQTVADAVGVHESTVSRVASAVRIDTPQGTIPLRTFFSAELSSMNATQGTSAQAVRHKIQSLIRSENPAEPLCDQVIADLVARSGVKVSRRTVAKYRDIEGIPSSSHRLRRHKMNGLVIQP